MGTVVAALCDTLDRPVGRAARGHAVLAVVHMLVGLRHVVVEIWNGKGFDVIGKTPTACEAPRAQELRLGARRVGRLELDSKEVRRSHLTTLEAVSPLLVRALAPHARPPTALRAPPRVPPAALEVATEVWGLTPRQTQALDLVARGLSNKEIATTLGCSPATLDHHVRALLRKSELESRAALVATLWSQLGP